MPANLAKQLAQIRKAVADKKTCRLIQCKPVKPGLQKFKIVESKIVSDLDITEITTKGPDKKQKEKQKGKTESPATTTKRPEHSTKTSKPKPTDKKPPKDVEKKPIKDQQEGNKSTTSKDTAKKPAQKKDEGKKPKLTEPNEDGEWNFSFLG